MYVLHFIRRQALIIYMYHKLSRARIAMASLPRRGSDPAKGEELPVALSAKVRNRSRLSQLPEVYTHTPWILREGVILEFEAHPPARVKCRAPRFSGGGASRSVSSFESDPGFSPRDRRSSQCDIEKETVWPVHFASLSVLHVLSTSLLSCVYLQRRRERNRCAIAVSPSTPA